VDVGLLFDKVVVCADRKNWTIYYYTHSVARQSKSGLGLFVVEVSRSHTHTHTNTQTHTHTNTHTQTHTHTNTHTHTQTHTHTHFPSGKLKGWANSAAVPGSRVQGMRKWAAKLVF